MLCVYFILKFSCQKINPRTIPKDFIFFFTNAFLKNNLEELKYFENNIISVETAKLLWYPKGKYIYNKYI